MKDAVQTHHFDALGNARQPDPQSSLEAGARESLDRWTVPGAAIGILHDGETTFSSFGVTSLETQQPVTPETVFRVASISKPFTATLAMTLVNDGLLDLDRPITEYLPGIALSDAEPDRQARITMRDLLSHTAGFDCELDADLATVGAGDDANAQAIAMYGGLHQWGEPGAIMSYGNTGFWLAGHVISTLLHTTFEEAMRERIFRPLGLERSLFTAEEAIVYPVALGHAPKSLTDSTHELIRSYACPRARTPSGGVISTVVDLL
ncbi:MAG: serine hydrolase domain-containing protein, partial [Thermomicrobiales bacterium]